jgi:hypothetical protein
MSLGKQIVLVKMARSGFGLDLLKDKVLILQACLLKSIWTAAGRRWRQMRMFLSFEKARDPIKHTFPSSWLSLAGNAGLGHTCFARSSIAYAQSEPTVYGLSTCSLGMHRISENRGQSGCPKALDRLALDQLAAAEATNAASTSPSSHSSRPATRFYFGAVPMVWQRQVSDVPCWMINDCLI